MHSLQEQGDSVIEEEFLDALLVMGKFLQEYRVELKSKPFHKLCP